MADKDPVTPDYNEEELNLAHLSDPHLTSLAGVPWGELTNKRILGYLSWLTSRKHRHQTGILDALLEDLREIHPDHIVITGDLTHIGTAMECLQVKRWLSRVGTPDKVTVIPGNHDRYAPADWMATLGQWQAYIFDESQGAPAPIFPVLHCRGPVAMICMSSAVPTAPFMATGRLGSEQLQLLDTLLADLEDRNMFRLILIHHGPLPVTNSFRRRLIDADDFISILKLRGAELVLHGHGHLNTEGKIQTASGDIPVFGVASASIRSNNVSKNSTYNLFRIKREPGGWMIELCFRSYNPYTGAFETGPSREIICER